MKLAIKFYLQLISIRCDILVDDTMAPEDNDIDGQQSQRYKQQLKTMSITKQIMTRLGWTACESNAFQLEDISALMSHEPVSGIRVGSEWKEVVASKR